MIIFDNKNECCGCGVCALSCPQRCITMIEDEEGFSYPVLNQDKCSDCGLCKKICAFQNGKSPIKQKDYPFVYAAKHKNKDVLMASSSGGAFTALSDWILDNGGIVFGVKFDENLTAITSYAKTKHERDEFRGSKYMQSKLGNSFNEVKEFLKDGKLVMFSGTPCQTAALQNYCKDIDTKNLYLCDLICYGVATQKVFKSALEFLENKKESRIVNYYMRHKSKYAEWKASASMVVYANGRKDIKALSQIYYNIFGKGLINRLSCYNCKYTNFNRKTEITIGDFWGIENSMLDFYDNFGVSLILVNSAKGKEWLNNINDSLELKESDVANCLQPMLEKPAFLPVNRELFWDDYNRKSFDYIAKKYGLYTLKNRFKYIMKIVLVKIRLFNFTKRVLKRI